MTQKQAEMRGGSECLSPVAPSDFRKCTSCDASPVNGFPRVPRLFSTSRVYHQMLATATLTVIKGL